MQRVGLRFFLADGAQGTIDPAFVAHSSPITMWAHAWWSEWDDADQLDRTLEAG